jgi:hypothetical protein
MALGDDLERIAAAAAAHGPVAAVLAAEPAGRRRLYLVALAEAEPRWLVLDDAGKTVTQRDEVRDAASIVAMCEVAADTGEALGVAVGEPPRLAAPAFLDEVGAAAAGNRDFVDGLRAATSAVEEFVRDVERGYVVELR